MKTNLKVADLKPAPYNPRKISEPQLNALGRAMKEFGDLGCIVFNRRTNRVVGGHQRLKHLDPKAAVKKSSHQDATGTVALGYIETPDGAIKYREVDWPEAKEKAANIAANRHGGDFMIPELKELLVELDDGQFDMSLTGFTEAELKSLIDWEGQEPAPPEDEVPEAPAKAAAKPGDVWILGRHRLLCGDATDPKAWQRLMGPDVAAMTYTDPPYGVSYAAKSGKFEVIEGDHKRGDDLLALLVPAFKHLRLACAPSAAFYVWHASSTREDFVAALKAAGLVERQYLIWAKTGIAVGYSDYRWAHEPCFYASRAGERPAFYGDRAQPTVWRATHRVARNPPCGAQRSQQHGHRTRTAPARRRRRRALPAAAAPQRQEGASGAYGR